MERITATMKRDRDARICQVRWIVLGFLVAWGAVRSNPLQAQASILPVPQVVVPAPRSVDLKKTMKWIGAVRQRCDLDATMREELEAQINGAEQRLFILEGEEGRIRDEGDLLRGERNRLLAAIRADLDAYLKDRKGFVQECQPAPRPEDAEQCKRWAERLNRTRGEIFQRTDALRKQVEAFSRGGRNVETEAEDLHARVLVPLMNRIRATARVASEKLLDDHNAILKDLLVLKKSKDPKDRQKYTACAAQAEKILARWEALEPLVDLRATVTPLAEGKLRAVMPALLEKRAAEVIPHLNKAMDEFEIVTPKRKAAFLAQLAHESGQLTKFTENLNYSAQGLRDQWPGRFTEEEAKTYARQQGKIANRGMPDDLATETRPAAMVGSIVAPASSISRAVILTARPASPWGSTFSPIRTW